MSPLAELVRGAAAGALHSKRIVGGGSWAMDLPAEPGVAFGTVLRGRAWARLGGRTMPLEEGDYLLIARAPWTLGAGRNSRHVAYDGTEAASGTVCVGRQDAEPVVEILAGHLACEDAASELLMRLLPPAIHLGGGDHRQARLASILDMLRDERDHPDAASESAVHGLVELLLVQALRLSASEDRELGRVFSGRLDDARLTRALAAIHAEPLRTWSVTSLATTAGMSRSSFTELFTRQVGQSPMRYLASLRHAHAKRALRDTRLPIKAVARLAGYSSASAFSSGFRTKEGVYPLQFRKEQSAPVP